MIFNFSGIGHMAPSERKCSRIVRPFLPAFDAWTNSCRRALGLPVA